MEKRFGHGDVQLDLVCSALLFCSVLFQVSAFGFFFFFSICGKRSPHPPGARFEVKSSVSNVKRSAVVLFSRLAQIRGKFRFEFGNRFN